MPPRTIRDPTRHIIARRRNRGASSLRINDLLARSAAYAQSVAAELAENVTIAAGVPFSGAAAVNAAVSLASDPVVTAVAGAAMEYMSDTISSFSPTSLWRPFSADTADGTLTVLEMAQADANDEPTVPNTQDLFIEVIDEPIGIEARSGPMRRPYEDVDIGEIEEVPSSRPGGKRFRHDSLSFFDGGYGNELWPTRVLACETLII